jgi:hypothetical protein
VTRLIITTVLATALPFAASAWQQAQVPSPPPSNAASVAKPTAAAPSAAPPSSPKIVMPDEPAAPPQATTETTKSAAARPRRTRDTTRTEHLDRSMTNYYTDLLNRRQLERVQSGGGIPPADYPPYRPRP